MFLVPMTQIQIPVVAWRGAGHLANRSVLEILSRYACMALSARRAGLGSGIPASTPQARQAPRRCLLLGLGGALMPGIKVLAQGGAGKAPLRVATASDMQFALKEIALRFEAERGQAMLLQSGSSGNLARQIMQGLAADIFFSADEAFAFQLADAGLTKGRGVRYASGRLAWLAASSFEPAPDGRLSGLRGQLGTVKHLAIANPEHAPYGRAAREALQRAGLWELVQTKLVLGENVAQAAQFVASGAAQAGIVSLSMARLPGVAKTTRHALLDEDLHAPLHQRLVVLKNAPPAAQAFVEFLARPDMRELMRRHGLDDPR